MGENLKLLVLTTKTPLKEERLRFKFDRQKELRAISAVGAKIRHDSGGRLIVIEVPEGAEKELLRRLRGARLVSVDADVTDLLGDLNPTESLFLEALKIRTSKSYREAKKKRKFGETPEEKMLTTGSCIRGY
jgi:hypothetical protein